VSARRQPERTCVGCRERAAKRDLVRVVRRPDGTLEADPTGRAPGRGAYVHRSAECMGRAGRSAAFARALRAPLPPVEAARLMEEVVEVRGERR
jgi:predicted RNA-binding protein YlxR (DUF448 family)